MEEVLNLEKIKIKNISIPATILKDYNCGLLYINIDVDQYEFKTNEKY